MDWWTGGRTEIKSVLRFPLYFLLVQIMHICTCICNQKLSPILLWVSEFDVKLGVMVKISKLQQVGDFSYFEPNSSLLNQWHLAPDGIFVRMQIMYIPTCIYNTNCQKRSYGFQNLISSWESWSKISKLQQVGDFSFFCC